MSLDRAAILAAHDLPLTEVDVPEWGGAVLLRPMTSGDAGRFQAELVKLNTDDLPTMAQLQALLVARCLVDAEGVRLFEDADIPDLASKSARVVQRLFDRCSAINAIGAGAVEELQGN